MKRKWWLAGGTVLVAALLSLCFFGVRVRLAPRWVLSRALGTALTELDARFENSPAHLFGDVIDPQGRQTASVQLETEQEYLGVVRYDMAVQTQLNPCRILSEGSVVTGGSVLDLELYMDGDFAAVSSRGLVNGNFYGITYDSFSQDIRSRELLAALIGEKIISQWEESVASLDDTMDLDITLPEFTSEDIQTALYGVLALKPQVSREHSPAGASEYTYTITFRATGQELAEAAEPYREKLTAELNALIEELTQDPMTVIEAQFYLHKGALVQIQAEVESSDGTVRFIACLGTNPETEPLTIEMTVKTGDDYSRTSFKIETASDETAYRETISLVLTDNGVRNALSADYVYDLSSGEMALCLIKDGKEAEARMHVSGEGEKLTITSQDIRPLLNLFTENPRSAPAICTLRLSPGGGVAVPEYRNLDQWSVEDLFALLTGLGGLLGLQLP